MIKMLENTDIPKKINKFNILLIQDNDGDVVLAERVFKRIQAPVQISVINDGLQAYKMFKQQSQPLQPIPHLILLDLNLPGISGMQVLKAIKNNPKYKIIPVIILTTSKRQVQIKQAYQNHANTYIAKPIDILQFQQLLMAINQYWLIHASLVDTPKIQIK